MKYNNQECNKFVKDMAAAKLEVRHYNGRFYWEGPSVTVEDIQDALSNTKIKCQWDNMGRSWVVYPKMSGKLVNEVLDNSIY